MKPLLVAIVLSIAALVLALPGKAAGPGGWSNVGGGLNDQVFALNTDMPGKLLVGGRFSDAGGIADADGVAIWDGKNWSAVGPGLTTSAAAVHALAYANGKVYAGGSFKGHIKVWDGAQWAPTCGGDPGGPIDALLVQGGTLYIAGAFQDAGGAENADGVLKCNLATGVSIAATNGPEDLVGRVKALAFSESDDLLYAGGEFIDAEQQVQADYIAKYDGSHWKAVGQGKGDNSSAWNTANVDALYADGKIIYAAGDDESIADDPSLSKLAKWTGFGWTSVGIRPFVFEGQDRINAIMLDEEKNVYVTGKFDDADKQATADNVVMFDGLHWQPLGSNAAGDGGPFIGEGYALAIYDDKLIVGGAFVDAGGDDKADRIASFPLEVPDATATLTGKPKKKIRTKRKRIRVTFKFTTENADKAVCKLDGSAYKDCSSPVTRSVGRGKHTFSVAGVNADDVQGKADSFTFRVVRKR